MKLSERSLEARADILLSLEEYYDQYHRCCEVYDRLAVMDPESELDPEVVAYIDEYLKDVKSYEGLGTVLKVATSVSGILQAILRVIKYVAKKLYELFKWCIDAQYRARKEFVDTRQYIISVNSADFETRFNGAMCESIVVRREIDELIKKNRQLVNLIQSVSGVTQVEHINALLASFKMNAGVDIGGDNETFTDLATAFTIQRNVTMSSAGWSVEGYMETIGLFIDLVTAGVVLKETQKTAEKDIRNINDEVTDAIAKNVSLNVVKDLQAKAALKIRCSRIIGNSLAVITKRNLAIANVLRIIAKEAKKIAAK